MKPRKLDHARLSRNLGSTFRGRAKARAGYFGALQLAESVRKRFRPPAGGGRARDHGWTMKRLIPLRPETLASLERLALDVSGLVDHRVEPLQVAALMIERNLESPRAEDRYWREEGLSTQQVRQRLVGRRAARRKR